MKKELKQLILLYLVLVLAKSVLSYFVPALSAYSDEYIYAKMARNFFFLQEFSVHHILRNHYLPLYSITISPLFAIHNMEIVYPLIKIVNSIVSSLSIFPAFFLAREFMNRKRAILSALLISVIPSNFVYPAFLLAENFFYPTFLFSVYFIYKSFSENKYKYFILAGIFTSLTLLSKISAVILAALVGILFLIYMNKNTFKGCVLYGLSAFLTFLPWLIYKGALYGFTFSGIFSESYVGEALTATNPEFPIMRYIIMNFIYFDFLVIGSGILLMLLAVSSLFSSKTFKEKLLTRITFILLWLGVLVGANHGIMGTTIFDWLATRPIGRYVDALLPIILLTGLIFLNKGTINKKVLIFLGILTTILTPILSLYVLFPPNNISLTHLGSLKYLLDTLIYGSYLSAISFTLLSVLIIGLFTIIPFILIYIFREKINFNIVPFLIAFFLIISLFSYSVVYYNAKIYWYDSEQTQMGLWLNSYNKETSKILFDERSCTTRILKENQDGICEPSHSATIMGFWLNDDLIIGDPETEDFDFLISTYEFTTLKKIKSSQSGKIHIYEK